MTREEFCIEISFTACIGFPMVGIKEETVMDDEIDAAEKQELYNEKTRRVLDEVMRGEGLIRPFSSVEELLAELNADEK